MQALSETQLASDRGVMPPLFNTHALSRKGGASSDVSSGGRHFARSLALGKLYNPPNLPILGCVSILGLVLMQQRNPEEEGRPRTAGDLHVPIAKKVALPEDGEWKDEGEGANGELDPPRF